MLAEVHGGKIGQHNVQVSPLRQTIGTGRFHQAVDHSTGPGSFYRVTEQPVLASHGKGTDGVLGKVIGNLASGVKQRSEERRVGKECRAGWGGGEEREREAEGEGGARRRNKEEERERQST